MKPIKGYENYCISKTGEVTNTKTGRVLKTFNIKGYPNVTVCKNGKRKNLSLHRLLAQAYIPNHDNLPLVRHLNDVKDDYRLENLAWGTKSDNANDMYINGYKRGKSANRKLTDEQVKEIFYDTRSSYTIAKEYSVGATAVRYIKNKKTYLEITKDL